ncbi:glycerate kinase type-2 family protein [Terriglobus sp.]|uniref:glycerate kinase type-2 family protein n=1 Tax=Terriglobus sp. TaxID=1889013 RepID=UPI003B008084
MLALLQKEEIAAMRTTPKDDARWLFARVMESVNVPVSMRAAFQLQGIELRIGFHHIDLRLFERAMLVAIGKAAVPMAQHAFETLEGALPLTGLVVGPGQWRAPAPLRYMQGDHPVPYMRSLAAAQALLRLTEEADADTLVLYLISGGASALAEAPLDSSISLDDMSAFYERLLHSGLPIEKTNALRKHFSAIKGGRLALSAGAASRCTLLISDVPPGRLDVVGSGPSLADRSMVAECLELLTETDRLLPLPVAMRTFAANLPETPKQLPEGRLRSICVSLLSSDSLIEAAEALLTARGYRVVIDNTCDDWDYRDAAAYLVGRALQEPVGSMPLCILSAGEVTVSIDGKAGTGGRNQQWVLEVARLIRGTTDCVAMSVGSDGIDGNSPAAGAVVDGTTWQRAKDAGMDPQHALDTFDAYPVFLALQDVIAPGPSGNNIRDLRAIFVSAKLSVSPKGSML